MIFCYILLRDEKDILLHVGSGTFSFQDFEVMGKKYVFDQNAIQRVLLSGELEFQNFEEVEIEWRG